MVTPTPWYRCLSQHRTRTIKGFREKAVLCRSRSRRLWVWSSYCFEGGHRKEHFSVHCSLLPKLISVANVAALTALGKTLTTFVRLFASPNKRPLACLSCVASRGFPGSSAHHRSQSKAPQPPLENASRRA